MKGEPLVIQCLQARLENELTAISQYFVHYPMFKHWSFERIAKKEYEESIGEMKHADALMERLFTLDALPNLQDLGKLMIGETLVEALACDLNSEQGSRATRSPPPEKHAPSGARQRCSRGGAARRVRHQVRARERGQGRDARPLAARSHPGASRCVRKGAFASCGPPAHGAYCPCQAL